MSTHPAPLFEIDQPARYSEFFVRNRLECLLHLRALQAQKSVATLYLDNGDHFFLTTIFLVDEIGNALLIDPSNQSENNTLATQARRVTLTASEDKVKIQMHLDGLQMIELNGKPALLARLPETILRLQRRAFFRITTPRAQPLRCKFSTRLDNGSLALFDLPLHDLSGGGLSLLGKIADAEKFKLGEILRDCRLEIPGESVLTVNLKICEILQTESLNGTHQLRLGGEFISLPGTRLTLIERYITRRERERKAHESGLD